LSFTVSFVAGTKHVTVIQQLQLHESKTILECSAMHENELPN